MYIYVHSLYYPKVSSTIFLIEDFFHLPPVTTTPVVHLELRISPRIFENWFLEKTWSRKSRGTVPLLQAAAICRYLKWAICCMAGTAITAWQSTTWRASIYARWRGTGTSCTAFSSTKTRYRDAKTTFEIDLRVETVITLQCTAKHAFYLELQRRLLKSASASKQWWRYKKKQAAFWCRYWHLPSLLMKRNLLSSDHRTSFGTFALSLRIIITINEYFVYACTLRMRNQEKNVKRGLELLLKRGPLGTWMKPVMPEEIQIKVCEKFENHMFIALPRTLVLYCIYCANLALLYKRINTRNRGGSKWRYCH